MWRNLANLVFTPDELLSYFEKNPNAVFDMKENGDSIVVKSDGECVFFEEDDDEYDATEGLVKTKLKVCHTLLNANTISIKDTLIPLPIVSPNAFAILL